MKTVAILALVFAASAGFLDGCRNDDAERNYDECIQEQEGYGDPSECETPG